MKKAKIKVEMTSLERINKAVELMEAERYKEAQNLLLKEPMMYGRNPITKTDPPTQAELFELNEAITKIFDYYNRRKSEMED